MDGMTLVAKASEENAVARKAGAGGGSSDHACSSPVRYVISAFGQ